MIDNYGYLSVQGRSLTTVVGIASGSVDYLEVLVHFKKPICDMFNARTQRAGTYLTHTWQVSPTTVGVGNNGRPPESAVGTFGS